MHLMQIQLVFDPLTEEFSTNFCLNFLPGIKCRTALPLAKIRAFYSYSESLYSSVYSARKCSGLAQIIPENG